MNGSFTIDVEDFVAKANNTVDSGSYWCRLESISNNSLHVESNPTNVTVNGKTNLFKINSYQEANFHGNHLH